MSGSDDLQRIECPECGKGFDVEAMPFSQGVVCPYCAAEIDT